MAWNEPGGSGGKDPWGGRKNEQGPPDLDEVMRKLQNKLGSLFGGSGGGNGQSGDDGAAVSGGGMGSGSIIGILLIVLVVWGLSGIYIIDEGNRGVVTTFGKYTTTTMPGPHWHARFIQNVDKVNVSGVRSIELGHRLEESLMLTQDENIVDVKFAVQYQVGNAPGYLYNTRNPDETMRQVMESAVREIVGQSEMDFIITGGRSEVVNRAQALMQQTLDNYKTGLVITQLTMQNAQAPRQVQGAFADAVKAREDEIRLRNEAEAYANDLIPRARGAAARFIEEANAYREQVIAEAEGESARFLSILAEYRKNPKVMRTRLYLDTMESVLHNSSKVIVDTEGGNNLLYLPLDKLMQRDSAASGSSGVSSSRSNVGASTDISRQNPAPVRDDRRVVREIR
ncbi:MAG: FtsH protease activity modulator HflK [Gammaproteobacteria bacterium]|nr:FtsH protease activity modulator HflK [Gammaproteobacteria bacterium]